MEWWLKVTPNRAKLSKDELVSMYAKQRDDGALDPRTEFPRLKSENGMESEDISGKGFTAQYVYDKLGLGHLFIGYETPGDKFGHCVVVYGIADDTLNFMDPARGMHFYRRLSYYSKARLTVAWAQSSRPAP